MLSLLEPNVMCLVQGFTGTKDSKPGHPEKKKKPRKLSILRRKKSPALTASRQDDNFLHPDDARVVNLFPTQSKPIQKDLSSPSPSPMPYVQDVALLTAQQSAAAAAAEVLLNATPGSSKARQKKFHRHFKQVDPEERVLDYFSCALVADILLQGHLYITKNHFAFYSNVFGYTTKLLIPTASVRSVTKEKTAYIIPNAVGVTTEKDKHVFGSLLSRDATYTLMVQVWNTAISSIPFSSVTLPTSKTEDSVSVDERKIEEEESSLSGSELFLDNTTCAKTDTPILQEPEVDILKQSLDELKSSDPCPQSYAQMYSYISNLPLSMILLIISTILVVLLFLSASVLIYRINRIQTTYSQQSTSRSFTEVKDYLSNNLEHLYKVRQSLETLSLLIENKKEESSHRISTKVPQSHDS